MTTADGFKLGIGSILVGLWMFSTVTSIMAGHYIKALLTGLIFFPLGILDGVLKLIN